MATSKSKNLPQNLPKERKTAKDHRKGKLQVAIAVVSIIIILSMLLSSIQF